MEILQRKRASTGNPWEREIGFSRAIRVGPVIYTAGTIASDEEGNIHGENCYQQCMYIFRKLDNVLQELGSSLDNVVKVTCFLISLEHSADFSRAHAEVFGEVRPATTCVAVSELFGEGSLVELELIAAD